MTIKQVDVLTGKVKSRDWTESEIEENERIKSEFLQSNRRTQILTRLGEIDRESIRPLRAKLNGTNTQADDAGLAELETEAQALRDELKTL